MPTTNINLTIDKTTVGLSNVDNTSDANKPVSTAQATAIGVVQSDIDSHELNTSNPHSVTKAQVGLSNVDNTSDANKPVSTAQQTALNLKEDLSNKSTDVNTDQASNTKYPTVKALYDWAIGLFVQKNVSITGATKTKVTYDSKGLITSGADATTADIADSSNKRYVTDAQLTVIGNTSGTNSGNETSTTVGSLINSATDKATPVDADYIGLMDSAASNILKKLSWLNIKANLKTYFDTLYLSFSQASISASAIDWNITHSYKTLSANTTFTFSNAANARTIIVAITNTASNYTVTWPTVDWGAGGAPVQRTGVNTDIYTFVQINGTIYGSVRQ